MHLHCIQHVQWHELHLRVLQECKQKLKLQVDPIDISEQRYMGEFIYMIYYIENDV